MTQPAIVSQPIAAATAAMSTANLSTLRLDCNRNVNLIVVHCTASRCDRQLTPESLDRLHRQRGFTACGYHFYITRDGITHVCRPIDHIGAHARCFNDHSIGVCYEGGLDEQGQPADTRTMEQKIALIALLRQLRLDYPEARIAGHNELSTNVHKACPCFKASREYKDL